MIARVPEAGGMLERLFPKRVDNAFRGNPVAIWLLAVVLLIKGLMGVNSMVMTRTVAESADRIPLDRFGPEAADAVLAFFAVWGFGQLLLALVGLLVLVRWRALIPFVFLLLLVEQVGRKALFLAHPIATAGGGGVSPGLLVNLALLAMLIGGLVLSLQSRPGRDADASP
jgi:hypothetical protein